MSDEPRPYTQQEMQDMFMHHLWGMVRYWERVKPLEGEPPKTIADRLEGLAFSMLTMLDGSTGLPAFEVYPVPHPEDKEFHRSEGENWWPEEDDGIPLHGGHHSMLHEYWHDFGRKHGYLEPIITIDAICVHENPAGDCPKCREQWNR